MGDYSSYIERDQFNEKIFELVEEFLEDINSYPTDLVLAIQNETYELKLCSPNDIVGNWDTYKISSLLRDNESQTGKEVDIDTTNDIASHYYFVK